MARISKDALKRWNNKEMYKGTPIRATIIKCENKDHWHVDSIGKRIWVKGVNWPSAYMEAENERSIPKSDIKLPSTIQ